MDYKLTPLERDVMEMLLAGDEPTLKILRDQFRMTEVAGREFTGMGFFTTFAGAEKAPRVSGSKSFGISDAIAEMDGLENGAGFVLHVRDGLIDYLEGYTFDEPWPTNIGSYVLTYWSGSERDLNELKKEWA